MHAKKVYIHVMTSNAAEKTDLKPLDLEDCACANLRGANLTAADFSGARLTFANLWQADVTDVNWRQAELPAGFVPQ